MAVSSGCSHAGRTCALIERMGRRRSSWPLGRRRTRGRWDHRIGLDDVVDQPEGGGLFGW